ncbi:MAG: hypothetical protein HYZ28_03365 [Myxococcales bacterium]|nr:hypothetical protein [Myxococcales bacterium]
MAARWLALPAVALFSCAPKEVPVQVSIVTSSCQSPAPLEGVTHLKVRVLGDGINPPKEAVSSTSVADRVLRIPEIPAGKARMVEIRAYAGEPAAGGKLVSLGKTLPFDVPDVVPEGQKPIELTVFLRQVGKFTPPNSINALGNCTRLSTARAGHTATLLQNGKVLIAGGYELKSGKRSALHRAEFFNPATGGFEDAPDLGVVNTAQQFTPLPRAFHTATLLKNGQVLIWGGEGYDASGTVAPWASVLIFDADQNMYLGLPWNYVTGVGRTRHAAALERSGKVLVVGGYTRKQGSSDLSLEDRVEWYDPASAKGTVVGGVSLPRGEMSGVPVQDGRYVAVAGGFDGTVLKDEVSFFEFDGTAFVKAQSSSPPRLREPRRAAGAALFRQGNDVLLVGGYTDPSTVKPASTSEIVTTKDSFTVAEGPTVGAARGDICAAALSDGRVLAIGGRTVDGVGAPPRSDGTVELLVSQSSGASSVLAKESLRKPAYHHTCTVMADGSVLVLGGVREQAGTLEVLQDALIYTPEPLDP